jgi:inorganic triphosphatase YgiF
MSKSNAAEGRELEVRYTLSDTAPALHAFRELTALAGLPMAEAEVDSLTDRYLDTPLTCRLEKAGLSLRVRRDSHGLTAILKHHAAPDAGGWLEREIETLAVEDPTIQPEQWPTSTLRDEVLRVCAPEPLRQFRLVHSTRRTRWFRDQYHALALSLDEGMVAANGRSQGSFRILEIRLGQGRRVLLRKAVADISLLIHLPAEARSKVTAAGQSHIRSTR